MGKYPKIKFIIDFKEDKKNALRFLGDTNEWKKERFFPSELQYVLQNKLAQKEKQRIVNNFVKQYFLKNEFEIKIGVRAIANEWMSIGRYFFDLVDKLFYDHPWPKGNYVGYASIFNMFPRDIEKKTFSFPYRKEDVSWAIKVIAHEMLHFIFFDYLNKVYRYTQNTQIKNKNSNFIWQLSEALNNIIENSRSYRKVIPIKKLSKPYPGNEKIYKKLLAQWNKKNDIKKLLDSALG